MTTSETAFNSIYFPSTHWSGIPNLKLLYPEDIADAKLLKWDDAKRYNYSCLTHFYCHDTRFAHLVKYPETISQFKHIKGFIEPNMTIYRNDPYVVALHNIYIKRWLTRFWQSLGLNAIIDIGVVDEHLPIALIGVPEYYPCYALRAYKDLGINYIQTRYNLAKQHSKIDIKLIVFAGIWCKDYCENNNFIWIDGNYYSKQKKDIADV